MEKKKKLEKKGECQSSGSSSESDNEKENSVVQKKVRILPKAEGSRWELPEDMPKYANNFSQLYIPENDLEKNVTKYSPAPSNIGRSNDTDHSYPAATSVK